MVAVELKIKNIDEVMKDLTNLGVALRKAIVEALKETGKLVKEDAIPLVRARSGKTRRSIGMKLDTKNLTAYVGSDWFVSRFLEWGTVRMKEYPFLRPALDKNTDKIRQLYEMKINAAIESVART
jgi:HK97 gp10 family phage protein